MTKLGTDWRVVNGVATAWFDAPSFIEGAALAGRVVELSAEIMVDLCATGMRVRLDSDEHAEAVSAAARDLGLAADPAALQQLSVVFESANPSVVTPFWQRRVGRLPPAVDRTRNRVAQIRGGRFEACDRLFTQWVVLGPLVPAVQANCEVELGLGSAGMVLRIRDRSIASGLAGFGEQLWRIEVDRRAAQMST